MARKDLNEIFVNGINENRLSFYKTAKAILKNEEDEESDELFGDLGDEGEEDIFDSDLADDNLDDENDII